MKDSGMRASVGNLLAGVCCLMCSDRTCQDGSKARNGAIVEDSDVTSRLQAWSHAPRESGSLTVGCSDLLHSLFQSAPPQSIKLR